MDLQTRPSPAPTTAMNPLRGVVGSISVLMLVAVAVQASAGVLAPALQARQHNGLPVIRLIAEVVRAERQVRRQELKPAVCRVVPACRDTGIKDGSLACGPMVRELPRLLVLLTSLPPPAGA